MSPMNRTTTRPTDVALDIGLIAALAGAALVLSGFVFGYIGDVEDFYSTAVTTTLFFRAVLRGDNPFWTDLLGLGMPQPFRISFIQHPLGPLFGVLPPLTAVKVVVMLQGLVGTGFFYALCRRLRMQRPVAVTCSVSFICCSSVIGYLFRDDFFSQFLSFCFYPVILYAFVRVAESRSRTEASGYGLILGVAMGLLVATGLASLTATYLLVLGVFFCMQPRVLVERWASVGVGAVVCVLAAAGTIHLLASEWAQFPATVERASHENEPIARHVQSALGVQYWSALGGSWSQLEQRMLDSSLRVVGFGPPAAVAAVVALVCPLGPYGLAIKAGFLSAIGFMLLPPDAYFDVVTATWTFRDGVNVFGILLFGLWLSDRARGARRGARAVLVACIAQSLLALVLAYPRWSIAVESGRHPDKWVSQARLVDGEAFFARVKGLMGPTDGRVIMTRSLADMVRQRGLSSGLAVNVASLYGLKIVNAFPRGIATSALYPDRALMEGTIESTRTNTTDKAFLDTLGIGHVLALNDESIASGLEKMGAVRLDAENSVSVWRNPGAWPKAVTMASAARALTLHRVQECDHDRFLCMDFGPVRDLRVYLPATAISRGGGTISLTVPAADHDRVVMINSWYRPGWRASNPAATVFPLFGQMMGISVPEGVREVSLSYRPMALLRSYALSTLAIVGAAVLSSSLILVAHRRARRSLA